MRHDFRKTLWAMSLFAGVLSLPIAASSEALPKLPQGIQSAGVIRIGVKCDTPPFGFSGPDGKPVGIEVEMAKQIAIYAFGSPDKATLTCVSSDARIPSLNGGKIDMILATLGKTLKRAEVIDFSGSYYWGTSNVVVAKDSPVQKIADLGGKRILATKGGSQANWFRQNMPTVEIMQLNSTADSIQALIQGRADAYAADGELIATVSYNNPRLRVVEEGFDLGANAIGIKKNEPELLAFVNAAINKMRQEKFYPDVVRKFVDNPGLLTKMVTNYETPAPPEAEIRP